MKLLIIFLLFAGVLGFTIDREFGFSGGNKIEKIASKVLRDCRKETFRPGCYDIEIPAYMEKGDLTMEEAFQVTKAIQNADKSYLFCHVLGHNIADIETKKDPDKWLDVISRCPPLACNNGCPHGAIMRKFKGAETLSSSQVESILPDLKNACEPRGSWKPTELEQGMCYHSMGHLGMYITGANVESSLNLCREIAIKPDGRNYYQTCMQGVFMIIFQGIDTEDIALVSRIKPEKKDTPVFCAKYKGAEITACRVESWPLFYEDFVKGPSEVNSFCSFARNSYDRKWCYDTVLRGQLLREKLETSGVVSVADYCVNMPADLRKYCFATVAAGWVQNEPDYAAFSMSLCAEAEKRGFGTSCYEELLYYSKYSFVKDSDLWQKYCGTFPGDYKNRCLEGKVSDNFPSLSL